MSKKERDELEELLQPARLMAMNKMPYMQAAIYNLIPYPVKDLPAVAGVTKHGHLLINIEMFKELNIEQAAFTILHESLHLLYEHDARSQQIVAVDHKRFNVAADIPINTDVQSSGLYPPKNLAGWAHLYGLPTGETTEWYYDALKDFTIELPCQCGSGAGNSFENEPGEDGGNEGIPGRTEADMKRVQADVASAVKEQESREPGTVPGGLVRFAKEFNTGTKINWRNQLGAYIRKIIGSMRGITHLTYSRISRKQAMYDNIILPSRFTTPAKICVMLDTSGSMSDSDMGKGLFQVKKILSQLPIQDLWFISVDAEVHVVKKLKTYRQIKGNIKGGGGTVFTEVFKVIDTLDVMCCVALSDCEAYFPEVAPKTPIIWVKIGDAKNPPFGKTIKVE